MSKGQLVSYSRQQSDQKPLVDYIEECDQIVVLQPGTDPRTINAPSLDEELEVWRLNAKCPQVVGTIIMGASVRAPEVVKALASKKAGVYESVQEYYVQHLERANSLLWESLREVYVEEQAKL